MTLLEWAQTRPSTEECVWLVPVEKRIWGKYAVVASDAEEAVEVLLETDTHLIDSEADWDEEYVEIEYESCGSVERADN